MNFLFISEVLPTDTYASEVVFYRHLSGLVKHGHNVHILTDQNSYNNRNKDITDKFQVHILPNRKWFYLPFKPNGLLQKIRFFNYYIFYAKKIIKCEKIDKLIGYVHGNFLIGFSSYLSRRSNLPLVSFLHDDPTEINYNPSTSILENTTKILATSSSILIASESFKENWPAFANKFELLYPIPSEPISTKNLNTICRCIGYSGTIYHEIIPALDKFLSFLSMLDIDFKLIGNNKKAYYLEEKYKRVKCLPLFPTSEEAGKYIIKNTDLCIIAYPEEIKQMPWIRTCFPSKFIQYCLLNMPTIIIAPKDSAIGKWCIKNKWILYTDRYEMSEIDHLLCKAFKDEQVLKQIEYVNASLFNPALLQNKFEEILTN